MLPTMSISLSRRVALSLAAAVTFGVLSRAEEPPYRPDIPKVWDEAALADWATPVAGLNVRPGHISPAQYYAMPIDNLRTYPVYAAGREPAGYWDMLQHDGPKPMVEPDKLHTEADWIAAGKMMFRESDHLHLRTRESSFITAARKGISEFAWPDGTIPGLRWIPTGEGVTLGFNNCANCHTQIHPDGTRTDGPSSFIRVQPSPGGV